MPLTAGSRLGPYEVIAPIGSGGMGEVFKARDTRLDRSVAIKVLPAEFANNSQLKLRFEREAKTISQLSHPNICTLYDVGDGYLVMELLEGETLADRIAKGPLPLDQVIKIGTEIANALARAHKAGVVHRDLKPSNVMLTKSGAKLLDFGLAKPESPILAPRSAVDETVARPITEEGTLIGTFQYMAPEQLEGGAVDARTDIFALGALLYEMVTGKHAFEGKSKASTIAAILGAEPKPITAWQPASPPALDRLIRACLVKDPDERWQSAHDVASELRWIGGSAAQAPTGSAHVRSRAVTFAIATALAIAGLAGGWFAATRWIRSREKAMVYQLTIPTPPGSIMSYGGGRMALSPDGQWLTFPDGNALVLRKLSDQNWRTIEGTAGAYYAFWSPDSTRIAFFARGALWSVGLDSGSAPDQIATVPPGSLTGTWSRRGVIVFGSQGELYRVAAAGGEPAPLHAFPRGTLAIDPTFLPDDEHLLCTTGDGTEATHFVIALDRRESPKQVAKSNNNIEYADGHLFFVRASTLYAQPFDLRNFSPSGPPRAVAKVQAFLASAAYFSVEGNTLVYLPAGSAVHTQLDRVDRAGNRLSGIAPASDYYSPRISHDGARVAVDETVTAGDVWIFDATSGTSTRLTFAPENESGPVWSPDDREIAYYQNQMNHPIAMHRRVAGGEPEVLPVQRSIATADWSNDGKWFVGMEAAGRGGLRVDLFSLPRWTLAWAGEGIAPRLSPDGKWLAYAQDERQSNSGAEVFVQPVPPNGSKWQVSTAGGSTPVWSRDGKSLYFVDGGGKLCEAKVGADRDRGFVADRPQPLFAVKLRTGNPIASQFDVFPNGTFILNRIPESATTPMTVVLNWKDLLAQ